MAKFKPVRVKKTLTLAQIADGLSSDIVGAIYSGVGRTTHEYLASGDDLDEVVEQDLSKHGFSETVDKLSSTRLQINVGGDVTGSMWNKYQDRPIMPMTYMMRIFARALHDVASKLPPSVFRYNLWLWGMKHGDDVACITDPELGSQRLCYRPNIYSSVNSTALYLGSCSQASYYNKFRMAPANEFRAVDPNDLDALDESLKEIGTSKPNFIGSGTYLAPMLKHWMQWEQQYGDSQAHRLDVVITDGALYDWQPCGEIQSDRRNGGKYEGIVLQVADYRVSDIPSSMTMYRIHAHTLENTVRDLLLDFVRRLF